MIRFLNDETVSGYRHGKGTITQFDTATEAALIAQGDAQNYPAVSKPVEVLSSSAISIACASTAVDETLALVSLAAGTLGVNSILEFSPLWYYTNSANVKTLKIKLNGTLVWSVTRTTTVREAPLVIIACRNSLTSQIQPISSNYFSSAASGAITTSTIDLSGAVDIELTGQRANSGDSLTLEYYRILHCIGA
jgi:hypothetical protein